MRDTPAAPGLAIFIRDPSYERRLGARLHHLGESLHQFDEPNWASTARAVVPAATAAPRNRMQLKRRTGAFQFPMRHCRSRDDRAHTIAGQWLLPIGNRKANYVPVAGIPTRP
jgi:hypothetical protein